MINKIEKIKKQWKCPCTGCKKAQNVIIDQIIDEYMLCSNITESENKLFCYTWWRHDDCERLRKLLLKITNDTKYTVPEIRQEVSEAINQILTDPKTHEILKRLEDNGI